MLKRFIPVLVLAMLALAGRAQASTITLGTFNFDSNLFGNTLTESDGGTFRNQNWLNVVNANPGNPGALTGANFDTGIANIGSGGSPIYTIGYNTPILNGAGNDLAIVEDTFSADTYRVAVSTDGTNFSGFLSFADSLGTNTGVGRSYFYSGGGPFSTTLNVIPMDLSAFGIASGQGIVAVRITGASEADLNRVAGFATTNAPVPEPATMTLVGTGVLAGLSRLRRRRRS